MSNLVVTSFVIQYHLACIIALHFFNAAFTLGTSSSFSRMSGSGPIGVI
jgi:hypothetical protein